jgi:hypothetical protein
LLSEHKCNKGDEARVPLPEVIERPWQLEPSQFPHNEPLPLSNAAQQPRQSRRLNKDENVPNGPILAPTKGRPPNSKRRKPNNVPPNSLAAEVVEEEESNADEDMEEDTVIMNGEDVVMKEAVNAKPEPEIIQVIPNDGPLQFGDSNTFIASWNDKSILATGYVYEMAWSNGRQKNGMVRMWTIHPRGENRIEEQHVSLPTHTSEDITSLCWHVRTTLDFTNSSQLVPSLPQEQKPV